MKLVKIYKDNCAPCKSLDAFLLSLGVEFESKNIIDHMDLIDEYSINSVPVLMLFDDVGSEVDRIVGFKPEETKTLVSRINED